MKKINLIGVIFSEDIGDNKGIFYSLPCSNDRVMIKIVEAFKDDPEFEVFFEALDEHGNKFYSPRESVILPE